MLKTYRNLFLTILLFTSSLIFAQGNKVTGSVTDAATGEKLVGASVVITSLSTGAATNVDGMFTIENVKNGTYAVTVSYIGYLSKTTNVKIAGDVKVDFALQPSSVLLNETVVKSTRAVLRETPVAFSEVKGIDIEAKLASRDLPMILASTPSVFANPSGGGAGDAAMIIRGFDQKNIAVMINGVPVNDMEGKTVYWSNWAGLGDVTDDVQIQRGLGASPYSINAVGGIVNVITSGVGTQEEYVKAKGEYGSDNLQKFSVAAHEKLSSNFAVTAFLSRKMWDGYAIGTYHKEWTYYFAIGGVFGNHSIELQAVGSPQEHGQRFSRQTIANWDKYGKLYNANVGRLSGGNYNDALNKYHKPAFNLNWNWQMGKQTTLSSIAYYSFGRGWGSGVLGAAPTTITTGEFNGYKDYDKVWQGNSTRIDNNYSPLMHRSLTGNRVNYNSHDWMGILSTLKTKLSPVFTLTLGIDGRYYIGYHYQEVRDLLGGDYYVDTYKDGTGGDINNPMRMAKVGETVTYNYEGHVKQIGGFGQIEYKVDALSAFVSLSASTTGYQRLDKFNFLSSDSKRLTDWVNFTGFTTKAGLNYNLNENNSVFGNAGYFETPPMFTNVFVGYNSTKANDQYKGTTTEKVLSFELGYQLLSKNLSVKANGFYTQWKDRAFTQTQSDPSGGPVQNVNIVGAKQLHMGAELEADVRVMRGLEVRAIGSLQSAKYQNDVNSRITSDSGTLLKEVVSYIDGLYVSNFPQTQAELGVTYSTGLGAGISFYVNPLYRYMANEYAYFSPDNRINPNDRTQSWQMPNYGIMDLHVGFDILLTNFFAKKVNVGVHVFNVLDNTDYILDATDASVGAKLHDEASAVVFYGRERWINLNIGFYF